MKSSEFILRIMLMVSLVVVAILSVFPNEASALLTAKINHDRIKIDLFYHGSKMSVSGEADKDVDLIIKITSPEGDQVLREKRKMAGFLWMNMGKLNFKYVPNLYFLSSTKNIQNILSREEMDKYSIGYSALENNVEITPAMNENKKTKWFSEFLKFKKSSKLYAIYSGQISTNVKDGRQGYFISLNWPYQAPPGDYFINVYAVKDNKVIEQAEAKGLVEQAGIVNTLADMAKNNSALYGILSILVAVSAGSGVSMIFRKGAGGAH